LKPADTSNPDFFHRAVDCQWSCPAHTAVPEYLRQVAAGHYTEAYMINWRANVFPGVLGRVCDRPCETACRRSRMEGGDKAPVAICRLKRTAADYKADVRLRLPRPAPYSGKRVACVGAGPASLTVARDLALQGHNLTIFDGEKAPGGLMRSQIPKSRLPDEILDEEIGYILDMGIAFRSGERIGSLKALLAEGYDAVFIGCGAPSEGAEAHFTWIERDIGLRFDEHGMPVIDRSTMQSTLPNVFFGGDAAFGPKNIISAVADGHEAAVSIDRFLNGEDAAVRPPPSATLVKQNKRASSFDNVVSIAQRHKVPARAFRVTGKRIRTEAERGLTPQAAATEAQRCLNCDMQPVFIASRCIECDACIDICPADALTLAENGDEDALRGRMKAPPMQHGRPLQVSEVLKTGRVMVRDEDRCLHCGLCAERCPESAWEMQKFMFVAAQAGAGCRDK